MTARPTRVVAACALALVLGGCDSSGEDCGRPGGPPCATTSTTSTTTTTNSTTTSTTIVVTTTSVTTTSSSTSSSSTSSTSIPSRVHACCLPDLTCDHMGELECSGQGGGWEPGGHIFCELDICEELDGWGRYEITFAVTNAETLGALQFDVDYGALVGRFDGEGGQVACSNLAADFAAFNDHDADSKLSISMIDVSGIVGPAAVAVCTFFSPTLPAPTEFVLTIIDQSHTDLTPAAATIAVTQVRGPELPSSTTTTLSN